MRSDDVLRSDEAVQIFENCLREEGLDEAEVAHMQRHDTLMDEFYVRYPVGSEQVAYKTTFDFDNSEKTPAQMRKEIVLEAEDVAQELKSEIIETFEWDGRCVEVCLLNGVWARCRDCDTKVHLPRLPETTFSEEAELSCPNPLPRDIERTVSNLGGYRKTVLKMYLIGLLRRNCDRDCPNSRHAAM